MSDDETTIRDDKNRIVFSSPEIYTHEWTSFSTRDYPDNERARDGDMVRIVESRPLSKNKRWSLKEVLRAATTGV